MEGCFVLVHDTVWILNPSSKYFTRSDQRGGVKIREYLISSATSRKLSGNQCAHTYLPLLQIISNIYYH